MISLINLDAVNFLTESSEANCLFEKCNFRVIDSICVSKIGRCEAVHVSPDSNKVAYASFDMNKIVVFDINAGENGVVVERCCFLGPHLKSPHDFTWIDDDSIAVANRNGPAVIFSVSNDERAKVVFEMSETNSVTSFRRGDLTRLVFCRTDNSLECCDINNEWELVSKGELCRAGSFKVPDGVAISPSGRFLAVTSALSNEIFLCDPDGEVQPIKIGSSERPHGVCFLSDDLILSTGGGDPFLYCWGVDGSFKFKFKALSKEQYSLRGSDIEGGVKGICFCPSLQLLFLTCPNAPFLIYDANPILK